MFAPAIESVGGPNEPDLSGDTNWVADTRAFQQMLYATVKGSPATARLPVVGPSLTSVGAELALGDLSSFLDLGSMHDYYDAYNPGTTGWGSLSSYGIYGSMAYNLAICKIVDGTKPILSTESGYNSVTSDTGGVDGQTLARYIPRLYLEHFLHGIPRSNLYEFYDEPGAGTSADSGLVSADNVPKPSYYAVQSLIALLADPGSAFVTQPLSYELSGDVTNVNHLLLQKRDGTYELVIWVETPSFDPIGKTDIAVPAQSVTITLPTQPSSARFSTIGDTGSLTSTAIAFSGGLTTIAIDDHVSIVSFK